MRLLDKIPMAQRAIDFITRHDDEPIEVVEAAAAKVAAYIAAELESARARRAAAAAAKVAELEAAAKAAEEAKAAEAQAAAGDETAA